MKFTAKIKDIGRTLGGSLTITLESHEIDAAGVMDLQKEETERDGLWKLR